MARPLPYKPKSRRRIAAFGLAAALLAGIAALVYATVLSVKGADAPVSDPVGGTPTFVRSAPLEVASPDF